jgi:hypothetical protein
MVGNACVLGLDSTRQVILTIWRSGTLHEAMKGSGIRVIQITFCTSQAGYVSRLRSDIEDNWAFKPRNLQVRVYIK